MMGRDGPGDDGRWDDHDHDNVGNDWRKQENEERMRSCINNIFEFYFYYFIYFDF